MNLGRRIRRHYKVGEGYWFAPRMFGWGATPVTWQGWLATLIFAGLLFGVVYATPGTYIKLVAATPIVLAFLLLLARKTEGGLHWQWGPRDR